MTATQKMNFQITSSKTISSEFTNRKIFDFHLAVNFVRELKYGRNHKKEDLKTVFDDNCGTCSTKHALLKELANENNFEGLKLLIGIFKMNGVNTPKVKSTLVKHNLDFIPEAHCYLKIENKILDATNKNSKAEDFVNDLICEIEIQPQQINNFKINFHKNYLQNWLNENTEIKFSLNRIWEIREQCIKDLAEKI